MEIDKLWNKIEPLESSKEAIQRDIQDGRVPELPYFIIDMKDAKERLSKIIGQMDTTLQFCLIKASYGNGKTNLLKYLKLFFLKNENVKVIFTRVDVDNYDLALFLLKNIQDSLLAELIAAIYKLKAEKVEPSKLCHNFEDSFASIKNYVGKIFESEEEEDIRKLIYLGTGRLYTKGQFAKYDLEQLTNFNRREILVFFLNILAQVHTYIIFALDEVEKIQEKSNARFGSFLTSFREIIDLSSTINGHFIIASITDSSGESTSPISNTNPAFYRRIEEKMISLPFIDKKEDIKELVIFLNELLETNKEMDEIEKIVSVVMKSNFNKNSDIIIKICKELNEENKKESTVYDLIELKGLRTLYEDTYAQLEYEEAFIRIHNKFFDPLEEFLIANNYQEGDYEIKKQGGQIFIDHQSNRVHLFLFTDDFETNLTRIKNAYADYINYRLVVYCSRKLDVTYGLLDELNVKNVEIIIYDGKILLTLLVMFRDENLDLGEKIKHIISQYTNKNL